MGVMPEVTIVSELTVAASCITDGLLPIVVASRSRDKFGRCRGLCFVADLAKGCRVGCSGHASIPPTLQASRPSRVPLKGDFSEGESRFGLLEVPQRPLLVRPTT